MNELSNYAWQTVEFWNSDYGIALASAVLCCGLARTLILGCTSGLISLIVASSFPALVPCIADVLPRDIASSLLLVLHAWYAVYLLVVVVFMPYCLYLLMSEVAHHLGARSKASV